MSEPVTKDSRRVIDIITDGVVDCPNCEDGLRLVDGGGEVEECPDCGDAGRRASSARPCGPSWPPGCPSTGTRRRGRSVWVSLE